jgi:DNA-binding transcriptional LysR family regulator
MSDAGGPYTRLLQQYFEAAGIPPPRTQTLGNVEGVKRGILAGGNAIGLLPAHAVEQELRDGALAELDVRPRLPRLVLRSLIAPEAVDSPLVDDLIGSLRGLALGA